MSRETRSGSSLRWLLPASLLAILAILGLLLGSGEARQRSAARGAVHVPPETARTDTREPGSPHLDGEPPNAAVPPAAGTDGGTPGGLGGPAALRARLLELEECAAPVSLEELLRIRAQLPDAIEEDYARAAAAQAVLLSGEGGADAREASARLAEVALEVMARRLASGPFARGDTWRAARVVLERIEWLGPEVPADLDGPVDAIRTALEAALASEAGRRPTEAAVEAMALAEVVGGEGVVRASLDVLRAGEAKGPPRTRETALLEAHAVHAALRHGNAAMKAEARAWVEQRLTHAKTPEERTRLRDLLDAAPR